MKPLSKRDKEQAAIAQHRAALDARRKALLGLVEAGLLSEAARLLCIDGVVPNEADFALAAHRAYRKAVDARDSVVLRESAEARKR